MSTVIRPIWGIIVAELFTNVSGELYMYLNPCAIRFEMCKTIIIVIIIIIIIIIINM